MQIENKILIKNANIVNEGKVITGADVLIYDGIIQQIGTIEPAADFRVIDATGKHLIPGIFDGQVHFRDPGNTHKGDLFTESKAAVAGGVTSFIDMPNTVPNVLTLEIFKSKNKIVSEKSLANYSFFMGINADNIDEVIKMDTTQFIGLSDDGLYFTKKGNLLVTNTAVMEKLFKNTDCIIAVHSENEELIDKNEEIFREKYGEEIPFEMHPLIRSEEACYQATEQIIKLAKKLNARLHILHLTTAKEATLFENNIPLIKKRITTEVCVQNLWFSDSAYKTLGPLIKWNPAIKFDKDKEGLLAALLDDRIDIITTDHAPHLLAEKQNTYFNAISGAPMVQHALNVMLELHKQGKISIEKIVEKMCHNPCVLYNVAQRGFIKEGFYADLVLVDLNANWTVAKENILYKCGWSPLEGTQFSTKVTQTFVNGNLVFDNGVFDETNKGMAIRLNKRN